MDGFDKQILKEIVTQTMPFGKFKGQLLCDIPVFYLEWLVSKNAMPKGRLGMQLATVYEIKINGLQDIIDALKTNIRK